MAENIDHILTTFHRHKVDFLLIGGMNFLLRHAPYLTYDVDLWIDDTSANRKHCEAALAELQAEWGASDDDWGPVAARREGWLAARGVYCLTSPHGAIDIFRTVTGLGSWEACRERAEIVKTISGTDFFGICDADMLQCQLALPVGQRNETRIQLLRAAIQETA